MSNESPVIAKRPSISAKKRAEIFLAHAGICHICGLKILAGEPFDIDHILARQLMGSDDLENLAPAHKHCHREKTKDDVKRIAKAKRVAKKFNPETRPKTKNPIPKRKTSWASRPFPKRVKP